MTATADPHLAAITRRLETLAHAAPATAPDELLDPSEKASAAAASSRSLSADHGWPARYRDLPHAPHGGPWLEAFTEASALVRSGGIVILHGRRGTGKTRMAAELALLRDHPDDERHYATILGTRRARAATRHAEYRTAMGFFLDVRATFGRRAERTEREVVHALTTCGLLVLDEIQERGESPWEDRLLTHLIDARYAARRPTLILANLTRAELGPALGPSIIDRIREHGKAIEFTWPSYRSPL